MQLAPNLVIAERFRLNRQLGRGGMGSVWHATHLGLDTACAVKFIEGEFSAMPEAQARFQREAKAAAQLRSAHVVQILDHGVWEGTPYIAMELLDGEDLGKRIQRLGRLPPRDLIAVIAQVCRALTKAHGAGIVHRDLKPDNIFLVHEDEREIAKVLDFGIAKQTTTRVDGGSTKTGAMLGTPFYMSPEQAQGNKSVDYRADLWSLAVICYRCVTGKLPFESDALGDLLVRIIVNPIPIPSHVAPDVPPAFDQWWMKAASRDPSQRFQSAKEFSEALGLAFGLSQMTDVMDRHHLRQALGSGPFPVQGGTVAAQVTPPGYGPFTPNPMLQTPQPHMQSQPQMAGSTTGNPAAGTFGGMSAPPRTSRTALFAGLAGAGVLVVVLAIVAVVVVKGKSQAQAASHPTPTSTSISTAAATATNDPAAATTPAAQTAAPTDTAAASASASAAPSATVKTAATAGAATGRPASTGAAATTTQKPAQNTGTGDMFNGRN
jgi:serine/threonine-protein kinase